MSVCPHLGGRGYPHLADWGGGVPILPDGGGGLPHPSCGKGYPHLRPGWGSSPILGQFGGYPHARSGWWVPPSQVRMGGGLPPSQVRTGPRSGWGRVLPNWNSTACTSYMADGMPLVFMQEDFHVIYSGFKASSPSHDGLFDSTQLGRLPTSAEPFGPTYFYKGGD